MIQNILLWRTKQVRRHDHQAGCPVSAVVLAQLDGCAGRVVPCSGVNRNTSIDLVQNPLHYLHSLIFVESHKLACAAEWRKSVDTGAQQEAYERPRRRLVQRFILVEGRYRRRVYANW